MSHDIDQSVDHNVSSAAEHYTFGDGGLAAERLQLLASTFEPSSAQLLRMVACVAPRRALDLGCGSGWSTRLLHALTGPTTTLGIDSSAEHVARARRVAPPGVEYDVREATAPAAWPGEPPDLLYCRFLLTHLRHPEQALAAWAGGAADAATLVVEETADISSDHPAFARYYALVDELQLHYGQRLRVGRTLAGAPAGSGWRTELSTVRALSLPAARMAGLHFLNLQTWRQDSYARAAMSANADELGALGAELAAVADGSRSAPPVRYEMRQIVMTKP
jgi:trans-aconitate 2-methyltransferase